jgi:hypothetical protein
MFESLGFLFTAAASINYLLLYSVAVKKERCPKRSTGLWMGERSFHEKKFVCIGYI